MADRPRRELTPEAMERGRHRAAAAFAIHRYAAAFRDAMAEWSWRQHAAAAMVRKRTWTQQESADRLKPWLAIACLCDCDLPELEEGLARHYTVRRDDPTQGTTLEQARILLAEEICTEADWKAELRRAAGAACDAHTRDKTEANGEHLCRLARLTGAMGGSLPYVPFPDQARPDQTAEAA